ncbi:uncharacterized protein MELLADRAFT_60895 [Melampsora larici-populina 98AG31]|uniref:Uncharacterized protein n=1 Tax=Melampsora larici-populina (strain 98AG31 / pathotype 3-4-7) TaxID=747676 RepID=F4RCU8_MELLP|nr:uncharacterized protein MELLADRAFT_60895 [Melampsora larici-populina 98AG31]EGG09923.1 hypothetical protein MELLADRAFT_60895 [Melampsora larici-populina 98AG31]
MNNWHTQNMPPNPGSFGRGNVINQCYGISQSNNIPTNPHYTRSAAMMRTNQNTAPQSVPYPYQSPVSQQMPMQYACEGNTSQLLSRTPIPNPALYSAEAFRASNNDLTPANSSRYMYPDQFSAYQGNEEYSESPELQSANTLNSFPNEFTESNEISNRFSPLKSRNNLDFNAVSPLQSIEASDFYNPVLPSHLFSSSSHLVTPSQSSQASQLTQASGFNDLPLQSGKSSEFPNQVSPLQSRQSSTFSDSISLSNQTQPPASGAIESSRVSTVIEVETDGSSLPNENDIFKHDDFKNEDEEDFDQPNDHDKIDQLSDHNSTTSNKQHLDYFSNANSCRLISINFNIWQLKFPPGKPPEVKGKNKGKQGKKGGSYGKIPKSPQPKWVNLAPRYAVKKTMNLHCDNWLTFRNQVFEAVDAEHAGVFSQLRAAYRDRTLSIEGWINGSLDHKKNDKALIDDDASFKEFAEAALAMPPEVKMGLKLLQPNNPKDDKDANRRLYQVFRPVRDGGEPKSDDSKEEEEVDPEERTADDVDTVTQKYNLLLKKFENIISSRENVAGAPNPANAQEVLVLNTDRIRMWARDWDAGVDGVDEVNPPMHRAGWRYVPVSDFAQEKARLRHANRRLAEELATPAQLDPNLPFNPANHSNAQRPPTINNFNYFGEQHLQYLQPGNMFAAANIPGPAQRIPPATSQVPPVRF